MINFPDKKYNIIYADPPWKYNSSANHKTNVIPPRREHSRKPDEARDKIVELFGDLPRIELFARNKTEGWDVWGNEVDKEDE